MVRAQAARGGGAVSFFPKGVGEIVVSSSAAEFLVLQTGGGEPPGFWGPQKFP